MTPPISKYSFTDSFSKKDNIPYPYHPDANSMLSTTREHQQREVINAPHQECYVMCHGDNNNNTNLHHYSNTNHVASNSTTGSFAGDTHEEELCYFVATLRHGYTRRDMN